MDAALRGWPMVEKIELSPRGWGGWDAPGDERVASPLRDVAGVVSIGALFGRNHHSHRVSSSPALQCATALVCLSRQ